MNGRGMRRHERKQWAAARTLADLGGLMAHWLEGPIKSRPGYYGPTDLDSSELTDLCADLCRAGVVTHQSQAADLWDYQDGSPGRARIFIEAFAGDEALARLRAAFDRTGLIVLAHRTPPRRWFGRTRADEIPVVEHNGRTVLTCSAPIDRSYVDVMWDGVSAEAYQAVLDSWQVTLIDPEWGRNEHLIDTLTSRFLAGAR